MYKLRNATLAILFAVHSLTVQAGSLLTLQASGHSYTPTPGPGIFDYPDGSQYPFFVHTLAIDLDTCGDAGPFGSMNCQMTSSLTIGRRTIVSPTGIGQFSIGPQWVSANYATAVRFDGGMITADATISADLIELPQTIPVAWRNVRNLTISHMTGTNATSTYYLNYDDLSLPQDFFINETGFETLVINPVPEPGTLMILGLSIIALVISRRREPLRKTAAHREWLQS